MGRWKVGCSEAVDHKHDGACLCALRKRTMQRTWRAIVSRYGHCSPGTTRVWAFRWGTAGWSWSSSSSASCLGRFAAGCSADAMWLTSSPRCVSRPKCLTDGYDCIVSQPYCSAHHRICSFHDEALAAGAGLRALCFCVGLHARQSKCFRAQHCVASLHGSLRVSSNHHAQGLPVREWWN
jgi:hypothetical protein